MSKRPSFQLAICFQLLLLLIMPEGLSKMDQGCILNCEYLGPVQSQVEVFPLVVDLIDPEPGELIVLKPLAQGDCHCVPKEDGVGLFGTGSKLKDGEEVHQTDPQDIAS